MPRRQCYILQRLIPFIFVYQWENLIALRAKPSKSLMIKHNNNHDFSKLQSKRNHLKGTYRTLLVTFWWGTSPHETICCYIGKGPMRLESIIASWQHLQNSYLTHRSDCRIPLCLLNNETDGWNTFRSLLIWLFETMPWNKLSSCFLSPRRKTSFVLGWYRKT